MLNHLEENLMGPAVARLDAVLILEDEGLLSMMMEDLVRDQGAREVHVCRDGEAALRLAREAMLDCAILDVSLHGGSSYAVADALAGRGIPFLFCTGMAAQDIEERHRHRPLLSKPYGDAEFKRCLEQTLKR